MKRTQANLHRYAEFKAGRDEIGLVINMVINILCASYCKIEIKKLLCEATALCDVTKSTQLMVISPRLLTM